MAFLLNGVFDRYLRYDEESCFVRVRIRLSHGYYAVLDSTCCMPDHDMPFGTPLQFSCDKKTSPLESETEQYYRFYSVAITGASDVAEAIEFLLGMEIKGIKDKTAEAIIAHTGADIVAYFRDNKNASADLRAAVRGLSGATVAALKARLPHNSVSNEFYAKIARHGITFPQARKMCANIIAHVPANTDVLERDTADQLRYILNKLEAGKYRAEAGDKSIYEYGEEADATFIAMDAFAQTLGYSAYHPARIDAFVYAAMDFLYKQGSTWASLDQLYVVMKKLTPQTAFPETVISKKAIMASVLNHPEIYHTEEWLSEISLVSSWRDEKAIAYHTDRLIAKAVDLPYDEEAVRKSIEEADIMLSEEQKECMKFLKRSGLKCLTGNAGTGKTTVISALIKAYGAICPEGKIAICAPTGRAAQRMTELAKKHNAGHAPVRASTIHKLLDATPRGEEMYIPYSQKNPLPMDMIIVDEMSMVDIHLFAMLVRAIKDSALLIICGDQDQLPSVGAGKVFRDMLASGRYEKAVLTKIFRQDREKGLIVENATRINHGLAILTTGPEFRVIEKQSEGEMRDEVIRLVHEHNDCTVLTATKNGPCGTNSLNNVLQPLINQTEEPGFQVYGQEYHRGDKVLLNRNNYKIGYVNGDIGTVLSAGEGHVVVQVGDGARDLFAEHLQDLSLAYAMTIHKSQGSEYDDVIIVLPANAKHMLARNLLYTAVTRGKKRVTIIAQPGAIARAVSRIADSRRQTALPEMLKIKNAV